MGKEIERKFLVNEKLDEVLKTAKSNYCSQSYLSTDEHKVVRIRVLGEKGFLTIKSKVEGISRHEFEYEIPITDAKEMIKLFGHNLIEKTRYLIPYNNHIWEVDIFEGKNKGLIIAEIELNTENEHFSIPNWIDKEVTGDVRYYNSNLQNNPYLSWFK